MKPGKSLLNPYAEAFVPLYRQVSHDSDGSTEILGHANEVVNQAPEITIEETKNPIVNAENDHKFGTEEDWSQNVNNGTEKKSAIEDFEVDMAYLAAAFPGISEQSLIDVYFANHGDLEASIDMLIQLECETVNAGVGVYWENWNASIHITGQPDDLQLLPNSYNVSDHGAMTNSSGRHTANSGETSGSSVPSDPTSGQSGN
ncbi:hypothetical protein ACLOJK_019935 [Asimina triloba]